MKFFTADTHFNHKSIIEACYRPFKNVWAMNSFMVEKWNEVVSKGDVVYHLGDFALPNKGDGHEIEDIIDKLAGTIILILGNHDERNLRKKHLEKFAKVVDLDYIKLVDNGNSYRAMLCHYPMKTWRASCHGSWHLHGHSHGNLPDYGFAMDVGVDVHNFYPISEREIIDIMLERKERKEKNLNGVKK